MTSRHDKQRELDGEVQRRKGRLAEAKASKDWARILVAQKNLDEAVADANWWRDEVAKMERSNQS